MELNNKNRKEMFRKVLSLLLVLTVFLGNCPKLLAQQEANKKVFLLSGYTTAIIFPGSIKTADLGSNGVKGHIPKGAPQVLLLKVREEGQPLIRTNFLVICENKVKGGETTFTGDIEQIASKNKRKYSPLVILDTLSSIRVLKDTLFVHPNQTMYVRLPSPAKLVNLGSHHYLVEARNQQRLIKLKPAVLSENKQGMVPPTSFLFVTDLGVFAGVLAQSFKPLTKKLRDLKPLIQAPSTTKVEQKEQKSASEKEALDGKIAWLIDKRRRIQTIGAENGSIVLLLTDVRNVGNQTFLKLVITNTQNIDYKVDYLGGEVITKNKSALAGGAQSIPLEVIAESTTLEEIKAQESITFILVFKSLVLAKNQLLKISLKEAGNGGSGRSLELKIPRRRIIKAPPMNIK